MILFISTPELLVILVAAVLIFGTDKIPEIARGIGKGMRQLRDATHEIKSEINKTVEKSGLDTSIVEDVQHEIQKAKDEITSIDPLGSVKRSK